MVAQHRKIQLSFSELCLDLYPIGEDVAILLYGGDRPHIGCTVLAVPRLSLTGDGTPSCTVSVINVTGHKDEAICRFAAETLCRRLGTVVTCSGGFHREKISPEEIQEVRRAVETLLDGIGVENQPMV